MINLEPVFQDSIDKDILVLWCKISHASLGSTAFVVMTLLRGDWHEKARGRRQGREAKEKGDNGSEQIVQGNENNNILKHEKVGGRGKINLSWKENVQRFQPDRCLGQYTVFARYTAHSSSLKLKSHQLASHPSRLVELWSVPIWIV